jgi:hypothetical protein
MRAPRDVARFDRTVCNQTLLDNRAFLDNRALLEKSRLRRSVTRLDSRRIDKRPPSIRSKCIATEAILPQTILSQNVAPAEITLTKIAPEKRVPVKTVENDAAQEATPQKGTPRKGTAANEAAGNSAFCKSAFWKSNRGSNAPRSLSEARAIHDVNPTRHAPIHRRHGRRTCSARRRLRGASSGTQRHAMTDRRDLVPGWESDHCVKPGYAFGRHPRWFRGGSPKIGPRPALQVDSTPLCLMRKKNLRVAIVFTRGSFLPPRSRDPFSFSLGALFLLPSCSFCSFLASFVVACPFAALFSSRVSLQSLLRFAATSLVYSHFLALPLALLPTSARHAEISRPTRQLRVRRRLPCGISSRHPLAKFAPWRARRAIAIVAGPRSPRPSRR